MKQRLVEFCDGNRIEVDILDGYHFKEGTVNDGYVIEDQNGNQFVRIPAGYTADGLYERGFWVSRFEISKTKSGDFKSIAGEYPISNVNWEEAMKIAEAMNGRIPSKEQYNRICMWLVTTEAATFSEVFEKGNESIGNYSKPFVLAKTGSNPNWMKNRLDCFWGNGATWTTERSELYDHHRIIRGGHGLYFETGEKRPPIDRRWAEPKRKYNDTTIRVVICDPREED